MKKAVIVMATYNGEKYIREQLESLINQSWKNISICIRVGVYEKNMYSYYCGSFVSIFCISFC